MPIEIKKSAVYLRDGDSYFPVDVFSGDGSGWAGRDYASPEMFGAVGDGITDDTAAWQAAVDSGRNVRALNKKYKCGQIDVTKSIVIDCGGATFNCTGTKLFNCAGTVTKTLTSQPDYTANEKGYTILSNTDAEYTGFAMLKGTNQFVESRTYYYGGFVCSFNNGEMTDSYPIDVEETSILLIDPITVNIKNIGDIIYSGSSASNKNWITITYGVNCVVEKFNTKVNDFYTFIDFKQCLNCECRNLYIVGEVGTTGTNSYLIAFSDSSFCSIKDSYLYNRYWHCATTGANYLCYRNLIQNCVMQNDTGYGYDDHDNGIGTILRDCTIAGCVVGPQSTVENVDLMSIKTSSKQCMLYITQPTNESLAGATVSNVTFRPDDDCTSCGIVINAYPQGVTGKTFYVDGIKIDRAKCTNRAITCGFRFGFRLDSTNDKYWVVKNLTFSNCDIVIDLSNTNPYADFSNMVAKKAVYEAVS